MAQTRKYNLQPRPELGDCYEHSVWREFVNVLGSSQYVYWPEPDADT